MKYRITIEKIHNESQEEQKYPTTETIYEQKIDVSDNDEVKLANIVKAVNGFS